MIYNQLNIERAQNIEPPLDQNIEPPLDQNIEPPLDQNIANGRVQLY